MTPAFSRRHVLQTGLALAVLPAAPSARACEFFSTHLRITHPWARASTDHATSAVVSLRFDEVRQADRLIGVHSPVAAAAELGGAGASRRIDLPIPPGQDTLLSEAGTHILLTGLTVPLEVGRQYPLQLVFEQGGVIDATLSIDFARFA